MAAIAVIEELYAADYTMHGTTRREDVHGLKAMKQYVEKISGAFPDIHYTVVINLRKDFLYAIY